MADLTVCTVHTTTRPRGKPDTVSPHPSYAATAPPCMHSPPCPSPHKFPFFRVETKNVEQLSRACPADMMARRYRHACRFRCYQGAHALEPLQTAATHPAVWCGGTPASRAPYARHPPPHPTAPKKPSPPPPPRLSPPKTPYLRPPPPLPRCRRRGAPWGALQEGGYRAWKALRSGAHRVFTSRHRVEPTASVSATVSPPTKKTRAVPTRPVPLAGGNRKVPNGGH